MWNELGLEKENSRFAPKNLLVENQLKRPDP